MAQRSDTTTSSERAAVTIRPYRPADHADGRRLWAELDLAEDQAGGRPPDASGGDIGAGFEEYLARIDLSGVWVAERAGEDVVGLAGLILRGRAGEVHPVVVARQARGHGVGRALLERVASEARRRGLRSLTVVPPARNVAALHSLYAAGFDVLSRVELTLDLSGAANGHPEELDFQGLRFR